MWTQDAPRCQWDLGLDLQKLMCQPPPLGQEDLPRAAPESTQPARAVGRDEFALSKWNTENLRSC